MPSQRVIPRPDPRTEAMFHNIHQASSPFLRAAGIKEGSTEHKQLKTTLRALHCQYLHPFKYLEEQAPGCVDQLIAKAQLDLPWLAKYEDGWPARIYLKRYVEGRRPHFMSTRYAKSRKGWMQTSKTFHRTPTKDLEDTSDTLKDHDFTVRDFLGSLTPNLEHHLDAFIKLGIKDQETLQAFLSWPQVLQAQFLDEGHKVLQLTSLERTGLLLGSGLLIHRALQKSLVKTVTPGPFGLQVVL